ncbi:MAG TPA: DUF4135 domain-containing protein, partial [Gemmatimonadota bacterium]|nr:DUF4135 domain-containing protein [Gemmatimonadota bacterium]
SAELARRLEADRVAIERAFGAGVPLGRVVSLEPGLSDRHRGGRTVVRLTFESGARVLHKPRSLEPERAFYGFLDWLDEGLDDEAFRPVVLPRAGYGWMEDVAPRPCRDAAEGRRFYRRAGRLLAALRHVAATDIHAGNVIASGGHPVPIDLETLLQPRARDREGEEPLLRVGVLPSWKMGLDGRRYDVGALTGAAAKGGWPRVWQDNRIGTDAMEISLEYRSAPGTEHLPVLDGAPLRAVDHGAEIEAGYAAAHRRLAGHRRALASPDGILGALRDLRFRVLPRPTLVYAAACHTALDPALLRDDSERAAAIERFLLDGPAGGGLLPGEREAIERMDVPLFHARADGLDLETEGGGMVGGRFAESGLAVARAALEELDDRGLERSLALVRSTLALAAVSSAIPAARSGDRPFPIPGSPP